MAIGRIPEPGTGIPESIVDAKGDIVTATAGDTPARLAVGSNETRLVADSAQATGLKYVADTTNYAIAAKGDLLVGTAADTLQALSVGTNGHTLVADSATATGLKWAAPATGAFVGVKMSRQATQSISNGTWTAVSFDVESFDTDSFWSLSPNPTRFTVPSGKAGKYMITGAVDYAANQTGIRAGVFRINNVEKFYLNWMSAATGDRAVLVGATIFDLAVNDYVELFTIQTSGSSVNISNNLGGNDGSTNFSAQYLGA